jgi:hypothetical protein
LERALWNQNWHTDPPVLKAVVFKEKFAHLYSLFVVKISTDDGCAGKVQARKSFKKIKIKGCTQQLMHIIN